jgi:hypothetical protein
MCYHHLVWNFLSPHTYSFDGAECGMLLPTQLQSRLTLGSPSVGEEAHEVSASRLNFAVSADHQFHSLFGSPSTTPSAFPQPCSSKGNSGKCYFPTRRLLFFSPS